jgi:hypothetical protein
VLKLLLIRCNPLTASSEWVVYTERQTICEIELLLAVVLVVCPVAYRSTKRLFPLRDRSVCRPSVTKCGKSCDDHQEYENVGRVLDFGLRELIPTGEGCHRWLQPWVVRLELIVYEECRLLGCYTVWLL